RPRRRPPAAPPRTRRTRPSRVTTGRPSRRRIVHVQLSPPPPLRRPPPRRRPGPRGGGLWRILGRRRQVQRPDRPPHPQHLADGGQRPAGGRRRRQPPT